MITPARHHPISTYLIFSHLLLALLLLGVVCLYQWVASYRHMERILNAEGRLVARMLQPACIDPIVRTLAYDRIPTLLRHIIAENRNIAYVVIHDLTGEVVASAGIAGPEKLPIRMMSNLYRRPAEEIVEMAAREAYREFLAQLPTDSDFAGVARVGVTREHLLREQISHILFFMGAAMLFVVAASLLYLNHTENRVIHPLLELDRLMKRFGKEPPGDLIGAVQALAAAQPDNEIGWMTRSFERMITALIQRDRDLASRALELQEQKEKFETIANGVGIRLCIISTDLRIVWANSILKAGYEDPEGQHCHRLFSASPAVCAGCGVRDILAGTVRQANFEQMVSPSGEDAVWHHVLITPYTNADNEIIGVLEARMDITQQKRAEAALMESEKQYRQLFDFAPDAVLQVDAAGVIRQCNTSAARIYGRPRADITGKPLWQMVHHTSIQACRTRFSSLPETTTTEGELRIVRGDGEARTIWRKGIALVREGGEFAGALIQDRDITDRIRMQQEKEILESQYQQAQKVEAIGRLAGGVAHDLNNLLSPILGYAELLLNDAHLDDIQRRRADQIVQASLRARDLVRQLLAFSRRQTLEMKPLDLNRVIADFRHLLRRTIREDIEIEIRPAAALPAVEADIGQIEQVIMNLSVNAADAMPDGGRLTIETAAVTLDAAYTALHAEVQPGRYALLTVSDTGCGMDAATRKKVFEPFFSTKGEKGTGLGLATVYGIVTQHGGHIWIYSEVAKGTSIKIYLPASGETPFSSDAVVEATETLSGSETILIAEDNEEVRYLAEVILREKGYIILTAENGARALDVFRTHPGVIDLLLTDVVMPGMNGKELFASAQGERKGLKVLYMTGYTDDIIVHHGVLDRGIALLQKPFTARALLAGVRRTLDDPSSHD